MKVIIKTVIFIGVQSVLKGFVMIVKNNFLVKNKNNQ